MKVVVELGLRGLGDVVKAVEAAEFDGRSRTWLGLRRFDAAGTRGDAVQREDPAVGEELLDGWRGGT